MTLVDNTMTPDEFLALVRYFGSEPTPLQLEATAMANQGISKWAALGFDDAYRGYEPAAP